MVWSASSILGRHVRAGRRVSLCLSMFELRCVECGDESFKPVVCTRSNELLDPDYDELSERLGQMLRDFHLRHFRCKLTEVELDD